MPPHQCSHDGCNGKSFQYKSDLDRHQRKAHVPKKVQLQLFYLLTCPASGGHGCTAAKNQDDDLVAMERHIEDRHPDRCKFYMDLWRNLVTNHTRADARTAVDQWLKDHPDDWASVSLT